MARRISHSISFDFRTLLLLFALAPCSALDAQQTGPRSGFEVHEASIPELQAAMERGDLSAVDLVDGYVARIRAYDQAGPALNAVIHLNVNARAEAAALDAERRDEGPRGPLHGIPILLKDNMNTSDMPTTGGSVALAGVTPPSDATVVRRLREAGAVILGKTNLHEMAYGYTTISSLGGQTRNPYDPTRNPGGSSGGTGAAVAASLAALGWGTDTCGSIRVPAASNGLFGLRPTKGLTSIRGILPLSRTQDVVGPLARTVTDLAIGLDATAGYDPADPATEPLRGVQPASFRSALRPGALRGARIGVLSELFGATAEEATVNALVRAALDRMAAEGAELVDVTIPGLDTLSAGTSVITYEFKFDLEDYLAEIPLAPVRTLSEILERGLYHEAVEGALRTSESVPARSTDERTLALERQQTLRAVVSELLEREDLDALAYPTVRQPPAPVGEGQTGVNCRLSAATGLPAISVPAGFVPTGLPVGLQLLGSAFQDTRLVALAYDYERTTDPRRPPPTTPPLD